MTATLGQFVALAFLLAQALVWLGVAATTSKAKKAAEFYAAMVMLAWTFFATGQFLELIGRAAP